MHLAPKLFVFHFKSAIRPFFVFTSQTLAVEGDLKFDKLKCFLLIIEAKGLYHHQQQKKNKKYGAYIITVGFS